ncbi:MAG: metalloprotease [Oscillospiraceae bacterium]
MKKTYAKQRPPLTGRKKLISVSAGFLLLFAALYFFDDTGLLSAFVPAVLAHEAGHALALTLKGVEITGLHFSLSGIRMDYRGRMDMGGELQAAALGPLFGLVYAFAASYAGRKLESEFLLCSAGISLVLTLFNLLPAIPLDGGRILNVMLSRFCGYEVTEMVLFLSTLLTALVLMLAGLWFFYRGYGIALIPVGLWLFWHALTEYSSDA